MKRSPLTRKSALPSAAVPLARRTPLVARTALATVRGLKDGTVKRPPRNTGPSPAVRAVVFRRADGHCERCGQTIRDAYSVHHRKPRGMGGTSDTSANSPANLVLLCGSATTPDGCHTAVERFRQAALNTGWIVARTADPVRVPVKLSGRGWVVLNHDGTTTATERPEG